MPNTAKIKYVEIVCSFVYAKKDAVLIALADDTEERWVPRTCLSYNSDKEVEGLERGDDCVLHVAEWFANKKGLI